MIFLHPDLSKLTDIQLAQLDRRYRSTFKRAAAIGSDAWFHRALKQALTVEDEITRRKTPPEVG